MKKSICLVLVAISIILSGCKTLLSDKISNYDEDKNYIMSVYEDVCAVFPDNIPTSAENIDYFCECVEGILDTEVQLFLEYTLSEDDYISEVERIRTIKFNQPIKFDDSQKNYPLPAYIAMENYDCGYEYVLLDEENCRIIYVYLKFYNQKSRIYFDLSYLPQKWHDVNNSDRLTNYFSEFNIY